MEFADKQLANRMLRGEEQAFEEFFENFAPAVYRFAAARLGRETQHAEELTQATLIKAISKLETYRGESGLFAWLCTFCRHEISAFHKSRNRRPRLVELVEESDEIRAASDSAAGGPADGPEASYLRKELTGQVHEVLTTLPPPYGQVLEWKYIDGLSAREIADRLGVSVKAAESSLTRARKAFRDSFAGHPTAVDRVARDC